MRLLRVLLFSLTLLSPAYGAEENLALNQLIQKTVSEGSFYEANDFGYAAYSLGNIVPNDETKPRSAEYFTVIGVFSRDRFVPTSLSTVTEEWTISAEGYWVIDQWIQQASLQGELESVRHAKIVETWDRQVLEVITLPTESVDSPTEQTRWKSLLEKWIRCASAQSK